MASGQHWVIEDVAIADSEDDLFDHRSVSKQLARIIRGSTKSLAIGLIGPFGSGKSSVVQMLRRELDKGTWAVLHVSAEHHSGVARARGLIYALLDEALRMKLITDADCRSARTTLSGGHQRTMPRASRLDGETGKSPWRKYLDAVLAALAGVTLMLGAAWAVGVAIVYLLHVANSAHDVPVWTWYAVSDSAKLTTVLFSAAVITAVLNAGKELSLQALKAYEITVNTPRPDSTDEFERAFAKLLEKINKKRVVIAVDDIDRLGAADVLEALATVRSLLLTGTHHELHPVFVLSCDEDIVREAIIGIRPGLAHRPASQLQSGAAPADPAAAEKSESISDKREKKETRKATEEAAQEYLNKLFTVRVVLPAHHDADLRTYAEELLLRGSVSHPAVHEFGMLNLRMLLEVLIHRDVRDPRHVIRLLNSFFTNYDLARHREASPDRPGRAPRITRGEVTNYPVELARLTVLRHDFRSLYDRVYAEQSLLHLLDDALLGQERALEDPFIRDFLTKGAEPPRLDLRIPGLSYLNATVRRAKTQRPPRIGPLLSLGSTQASRHLGSEMATAIETELVQGDSSALAQRLEEAEQRARVLQAATSTLDATRPGLDRDNAVEAILDGLARVPLLAELAPQDDAYQPLRALTDRVVRSWDELTVPVPSRKLVPLLSLTDSAHEHRLLRTLKGIPAEVGEAQEWALALLTLPPGRHRSALAPSAATYFERLAQDGTSREGLQFWSSGTVVSTAMLPLEAFVAMLILAARYEDPNELRQVGLRVVEGASTHQWGFKVIRGLAHCLTVSEDVRTAVVEILVHTTPSNSWGVSEDTPELSLANQIVLALAEFLSEDNDEASMLQTTQVLAGWLPAIEHLTHADEMLDAVAKALGTVAAMSEEIVRVVAKNVLPALPDPHAASLAHSLAHDVLEHRGEGDLIGLQLRESLLLYLQHVTEESSQEMRQAADVCVKSLSADVETLDSLGHFARQALGRLMTTYPGRAIAPVLAERIISGIEVQRMNAQVAELLPSLHLLLRDQAVSESYLGRTLQVMHTLVSSNQVLPAASFVAQYVAHPALDATWLQVLANHWASLPDATRDQLVAAVERPDRGGALTVHLIDHLLTTQAVEPWQQATTVWAVASPEGQSSLLARELGRAPGLAECAKAADADLLCAALVKAGADINAVLHLISTASDFDAAITLFVDYCLARPEWEPDLVRIATISTRAPERLWELLLPQMTTDEDTAIRIARVLCILLEHHAASAPDDLVEQLHPILRDARPSLARALGEIFPVGNGIGDKLRKTLNGLSSSPEAKARNLAFKEGRGR